MKSIIKQKQKRTNNRKNMEEGVTPNPSKIEQTLYKQNKGS